MTPFDPEILELVDTLARTRGGGGLTPPAVSSGLERWARLLRQKRAEIRKSDAHFRAFTNTNDAFRAYLEGVLDAMDADLSTDEISTLKHALEDHFAKETA